ncbi:MAG: ATP-binding domain-containing protein, partial [Deltaproteobacteria bacterium]|nr:ATP-binding domain-containing protein [Deltaproteobacteria bacterium]
FREDDTLLLLLYREMAGPLRSQKQKPLRLAHLMVDEAQDFSPLELDLLLGLVDEPRSVTLAGDAAQKLFLHNGFNTWQDVLTHLGLKGTSIAPLKVGYRCTGEIMELAAHVLGPLAADRTWQATRSGAPVELLTFSDRGQAVAMLAQSLRLLAGREPSSYVCVIARHPQQAQLYYQGLAAGDVPRLRRVDRQNFAFAPGVEVTDITQVKGLEFDYVILLDVDTVNYPEDDPSRYMLHVGATRAAHQLWLVCCGQPSPLLPPALLETDL